MKTCIDVRTRAEGRQIRAGLERPDVRAFVKIVGTLDALPSVRSRARVLRYFIDKLDEEKAWPTP